MIPVFGNVELAKADLDEVPHMVYFMKLPTALSPKPGGSRVLKSSNPLQRLFTQFDVVSEDP